MVEGYGSNKDFQNSFFRYTWFDRDLTLAGRVLVATDEGFESKLVYIDKPILRVPSLAIHLDRSANDSFSPNKETALLPVLGSVIKQYGFGLAFLTFRTLENKVDAHEHNTALVALLATQLGVEADKIRNFELTVCDHQDSVIGGLNDEYIFSGRLGK
jgi:aspartyl aminopeptidase